MTNKKYVYGSMVLATFLVLATVATVTPVFAEDGGGSQPKDGINISGGLNLGIRAGDRNENDNEQGGNRGGMMRGGIFGTVTAVSGNTITISGKQGFGVNAATLTTFTVDATNAKIIKDGPADAPTVVPVSSINVGDRIMVQGVVNGTNITATMIRDGKIPMMRKGGDKNPPVSPIAGDGNPVIAGTVTAVSGSTVTITNKSNVIFTVDATNAKIVKGPNTIAVSGIAVGDMVVVQGTINGNSVVATSVIDQAKPVASNDDGNKGEGRGFFGGIGAFFSRLFGF